HLESTVRSAYWQQQQISSGNLSFDLENQKVDFSANLGSSDGTGIIMAGIIDFSLPTLSYQTGGNVRKLDIAMITGSPEIKSDLNGSFDLKGEGNDIASLNLKASMTLEPSTLKGFPFTERSTFTAGIVQSAGFTSVTLTNDAFELSLQGNTSMTRIKSALQRTSDCIMKTTGNRPAQQPPRQALSPSSSPCSFNYKANIRDLAPLRPFLSLKDLQFIGTASGQVADNGSQISIDTAIECSTLSSGATFSIHNATLKGTMICSAEEVSSATASGASSSISLVGNEFRNLRLLSSFDKGRLDTSLELAMPQLDNKLSAAFHTRLNANLATIIIDRFQFVGPQGIWQAPSGSTIDIASDFTRFNRISLYKGSQSMELDGLLSSSLPGAFRCTLSNIDLGETKFFLLEPRLKRFNGMANALLTVSGTPGAKITELALKGTEVTYDEFRIGTVNLQAIHTGENLQFSFESKGTPTETGTVAKPPVNTIKGSGSIPMQLTFAPFRIKIPETQPLQASFHSDDLSSEIITSIVPIFDYAEGTLPTDLRIAGTLPNPDIFLSTSLDGTRIRIAPTRVTYLLKGHIVGTPSRIDLKSLEISDSQGGTGSINGMIAIEGLKPVSVNLAGTLRNLLLYNKKDLKDDTSFGTISASTDNLRFHGALSAPTAEGELKLTSANFSLYRKGSNESNKYIGVDKFIRFVPRRPLTKPVETVKENPDISPQFNYNLLDIIQIRNLRLSCNVPVRGTMIFDRIRGERIEATMNNLSLLVNKSEQRFSLYGSVEITGGKYLFSNSSFDLDNGGRINWNNEEIRNGHLSDIYGSKQVSAYNTQTGDRDNVKLLIAVSGTIDLPNVRMGYYLNNDSQPYSAVNMIGRQPSHIDPNADLNVISMLFSRQWYLNPERQATGGYNPVSIVGVSAGTGLLSSQVSGLVQDIAGLESFNVNLGTGTDGNLSGLELYFALLVPGTDGKIRFIGTGSTPVSRNSVTSNYDYGSSQKIEYRVNPRVYIEAFRSQGMTGGDAAYSNLQKPTENWGTSISYREKFHTWCQLWDHLFGGKKKEKTDDK
ncbi:MAG: translocation/assembly module TamB, partial [Chlorobiaceae bacterium]|nr:translocation/assembly module TamB [Chlorobiaceae bacterium]